MTTPNVSNLSLPEIRGTMHSVYRRGGGSRPDVLLVEVDGQKAVLKDHGACDPWFARVLGPLLSAREARALTRLEGIRGVPRLLGRPDARSLLLEHLDADPLGKRKEDTDWGEFFTRLEELLAKMHARGIAHCDLRSPYNTLIDTEAHPVVVDFVASISRGQPWNVVANWTFERFAAVDKGALTKLKNSVAPELVGAHDHQLEPAALDRAARWIGARTRQLSRQLFTRTRE